MPKYAADVDQMSLSYAPGVNIRITEYFFILHAKGFDESKIDGMFSFIENYVLFENPENNRNFKGRIDKITNKPNTMDILEQVAEIRVQEDSRETAENLLRETDLTVEKVAILAKVPVETVLEIKEGLHK
jgi:hypothetical protein